MKITIIFVMTVWKEGRNEGRKGKEGTGKD